MPLSPLDPRAHGVVFWPVRLSFPLFLMSLILPGFWFNPSGFGGDWFRGWQVLGYSVVGVADDLVVWLLSLPVNLALAACVASYVCFMMGRYRAVLRFAIPCAAVFTLAVVLATAVTVSELERSQSEKFVVPGPGLILWAICPALNALAARRTIRRWSSA